MAQKRAALLEKRMRREKESQQRKMQLEAELEQKKEEARYVDTSTEKVHSHFSGGMQCCVLSILERENELVSPLK